MALINISDKCLLPDHYEYKIISFEQNDGDNFTLSFRIKDMKSEDNVKKWLNDYEEKSKFTWRIARTYKAAGRLNIWRCDYRCQHKTDARYRSCGKKISKDTGCQATLKIVIKRYFDSPKLRKLDEETQMFPCIIDLHSWHNHSSNSTFVLRFRDMSSATREKLLHLFQTGHSAASARHALRAELLNSVNSDDYHLIAADSSIVPSLSVIQHLFNKTFPKDSGAKHLELSDNEHDAYDDVIACSSESENNDAFNSHINIKEDDKESIKQKLEELCSRILYGLEHNPKTYIPAVKTMLSNIEKHASTETGLISAISYFARYKGQHTQSVEYCRRKENQIVQPREIGRRKAVLLSGKRKRSAGPTFVTSKFQINSKRKDP